MKMFSFLKLTPNLLAADGTIIIEQQIVDCDCLE